MATAKTVGGGVFSTSRNKRGDVQKSEETRGARAGGLFSTKITKIKGDP